MTEIEFNVFRGENFRSCLIIYEINDNYDWCIFVGLWETSMLIKPKNKRSLLKK